MLSLHKTLPSVFMKDERKLNALLTTLFYELSFTTLPPKSRFFQGQVISWPGQQKNYAYIPEYCWDEQWNQRDKDDKTPLYGKVHVSMESLLNAFI